MCTDQIDRQTIAKHQQAKQWDWWWQWWEWLGDLTTSRQQFFGRK